MDKKPGGFLQRIARMPKAIKSAVLSLPIIGATSGSIQSAAANDVERLREDKGIVEVSPTESPRSLISEARQMRIKVLENQGLLKMSESEYDKYFEEGKTRQRLGTANCASLAAITGYQHSPQLEAMARSSMKRYPDGSWDVSLPLMNDDGKTVRVTPEEMGSQDNPNYKKPNPQMGFTEDPRRQIEAPNAPEGIRALEAAIIKKNFGTDEKGVVRRDKAEMQVPLMALDDIAGDNFKQGVVRGPIRKIKTNNGDQDYIVPFSYDSAPEKQAVVDNYLNKFNPETEIAIAGTQAGSTRHPKLNSSHAYSLRDTDPSKKTVTLVDPKDTSKTLELSYEEFKKDFSTIQYVRPNHAEILKNLGSVKKGSLELRTKEDRHSKLEGIPDQSLVLKDLGKKQLMGAGSASSSQPIPKQAGTIQRDESNTTQINPQHSITPTSPQITNIPEVKIKLPSAQPPLLRSTPPITRSAGSTINTSFTATHIITETPGSQDIHDEITKTHTQPSPSFTPGRVLNRQFIKRPVGGGGGAARSLASRGGNKMMGRLGMQAGRVGAQLAAQAAMQASRLLLNPYVLLALGVFFLILIMVITVTNSFTGTGTAEEKKVSGTGGSCGPVTYKGSDQLLTDSEARTMLSAAGLGPNNIKVGVSLEGIRQNTICGIINFKNESGLNNIVITSGTDGNHSTRGTQSHQNGWKLDLRLEDKINNQDKLSQYIISSYIQGATRTDGALYFYDRLGNGFYLEKKIKRIDQSHWDIAFIGNNCQTKIGEVVNPSEENGSLCEMPAQETPENTVLSVQGCSEKWAADINSNPLKQNFGDPDCDFDQSTLYDLLTELDPDQADHWFNAVIKKESGFRPNFYSKSLSSNDEKWGLFRMGNGALDPANRGNTNWRQQVANAVAYCRELNSRQISCACYWESWGESCNIKR